MRICSATKRIIQLLAYSIKTGQDLTPVPTLSIITGDPEAIKALAKNIKTIHASNILDGVTGSLNPLSSTAI